MFKGGCRACLFGEEGASGCPSHKTWIQRLVELTASNGEWAVKWSRLFARLLLGGLFLVLSFDKIQHPRLFAEALVGYDLFPMFTVPSLALFVPWVEFLGGLFLVLGLLSRGSALLLLGLSTAFGLISLITLLRGLETECGCFTGAEWATVSWSHFSVNILMAAIAASLFRWGVGPVSLDLFLAGDTSRE